MEKLKRVVVKEEYVALTGDMMDAIILNQFIYWSERVKDFDKFMEEERKRARSEGKSIEIQPVNGWIYKTCEELAEETMLKLAPTNMRNRIKKLEEKGWIEERTNPEYKWDRTKQYRVNLVKIHQDLLALGYYLQDYKINLTDDLVQKQAPFHETENACDEAANRIHETGNGVLETGIAINEASNPIDSGVNAIPEITTEITTEKIKSSLSVSPSYSTVPIDKDRMGQMNSSISEIEDIADKAELQQLHPNLEELVRFSIQELYYNKDLSEKLGLPTPVIRERLKAITHDAVLRALAKYDAAVTFGTEIRKPASYFAMCLWSAIMEHRLEHIAQLDNESLGLSE